MQGFKPSPDMEERGTRQEMQEGFVGHKVTVLIPDRCIPQRIPQGIKVRQFIRHGGMLSR
ncbi:hypothetical protein NUBL21982_42820 [Klebsiella pneumoniae]|nr:hypothetical protein NUBL21982_42820 [Klebsiella pneumoniae]